MKSLLFISALFATTQAAYLCQNSTISVAAKTDFLFLLDISGSMGNKINGVVAGLNAFVAQVQTAGLDARYAIVAYGGYPTIRLPLVADTSILYSTMSAITVNGGGQEAALEALRAALTSEGRDMKKGCPSSFPVANCTLSWRAGATKVFILATDEDSDLPTLANYRFPGQSNANSFCVNRFDSSTQKCSGGAQFEPPFNAILSPDLSSASATASGLKMYYRNESRLRLINGFEEELQATADLLNVNNVFLNLLIGMDVGTGGAWTTLPTSSFDFQTATKYKNWYYKALKAANVPGLNASIQTAATYQFGNPALAAQDANYGSFDSLQTRANLANAGLQNSLQYRVLAQGNFARVYDVATFISTTGKSNQIINAFYSQLVSTTQYISQQCVFSADPAVVAGISTVPTGSAPPGSVGYAENEGSSYGYDYGAALAAINAGQQASKTTPLAGPTPVATDVPKVVDDEAARANNQTPAGPSAAGPSPSSDDSGSKQSNLQQVAGPSTGNQNSGATAGFAVAGVGAAACCGAAAFMIVMRRKRASAKNFLGNLDVQEGSTAANPLYAGQSRVMENALFEKPEENLV